MSEQEIIQQLQRALDKALVGGNHLASNLIGKLGAGEGHFPPYGTPHEEVRKMLAERFPTTWLGIYEQWCCWNALMEARAIARKALAEYSGKVLGIFDYE